MFFNNPDIIENDTDIVLGGMVVEEDGVSFLSLIRKATLYYSIYIRKDVEALMSETISHEKALMLTAVKIYTALDMYEQIAPTDEEHLAELMMRSKNFETWQSDVKRKFFETHTDKVGVETKVPVTKEGAITQEEIKGIKDSVTLDLILEKLSMYLDIGSPSNY